ncbi:MAG: VUT family protein [Ruminococcaceae bacterium]|nr:VUT family protein [Oscillospiraceae bacterium]
MKNEILLLLSVLLIYGGVLICYRLFGKHGLFAFSATATVLANIEVLIIVNAFGMEQTLGNVMFASTYLITDILSENENKKDASRAVYIGIFTSIAMLVLTQLWMLFTPSSSDFVMPAIKQIFSTTPRLMLASILGYAVSQRLDVALYHTWWDLTSKGGDSRRMLWLRNNFSTLISQLINTVLFTSVAFFGLYDMPTFISIMISSYVIYIFTSLLDTPAVYIARRMKEKGLIKQ